jgi:fucose permease
VLQVRNGQPFASGMTATGFWLGITVGRVVLGFITPMLGEKLAVMVGGVYIYTYTQMSSVTATEQCCCSSSLHQIYIPAVMGLELLFWLVPQFIVSAVAVALQGFFLGPLFPAAIVAATKSLPKHLHVSAIGFAAAFGGGGAAVLPFAVGAIAQSKGVGVLQPIILALLGVLLLLWISLPNFSKKKE